jgi:uncharacterized secreted protein with C-terminal beta-propeller domain
MKKNEDLDFIKAKLNDNGVNAPDDINEKFVLDKIDGKKAEKIKMPVKKKARIVVSSLVACIAIFAVIATAVVNPVASKTPITTNVDSVVQSFNDYSEVKATIKQILKNNGSSGNVFYSLKDSYDSKSTDVAMGISETVSESSGEFAQTYKQVDAVDESDIVKTDGKYIYYVPYASGEEIFIYNTDKTNPKQVAKIDTEDMFAYDLYVTGEKLIAFFEDYESEKYETKVCIYDLSNINDIKKIKTFTQSGYYFTSRIIGNMLYTLSNQTVYNNNDLPYYKFENDKATNVEACNICYIQDSNDENFLVISQINIDDLTQNTKTKAILGAGDEVYCNEKNMYIFATKYEYKNDYQISTTQIVKANLENGINFVASATVDGYINSKYSLDEYNDNLRVATTSTNSEGENVNNLFVLDSDLNQIGNVKGFAKEESIKAVKYVGDTAYVITYEETDPLFVIDLSNATSPTILGEVKIDGFSSMLVPVGDDKLLGIGYYTENTDYTDLEVTSGLKLVLFDVSDKSNPKVLDEKIYRNCDSEVQTNPKALVYNSARDCYTIPINYSGISSNSTGGEITFSVDGDNIKIDNNYETDKFVYCERCTYVDDTIYLLSSGGEIDCVQYK